MVTENVQPTSGASGVGIIATRFWPRDKLRYCVIEYWSCGGHPDEEFCPHCQKRVVTFRYSEEDALAVVDSMLAGAGA